MTIPNDDNRAKATKFLDSLEVNYSRTDRDTLAQMLADERVEWVMTGETPVIAPDVSRENIQNTNVVRGTLQTPLHPDIIPPPIPDEQWKPHVAVDMTKDTPQPERSFEDELRNKVYRQNRINP
jgi:hypothetical protein